MFKCQSKEDSWEYDLLRCCILTRRDFEGIIPQDVLFFLLNVGVRIGRPVIVENLGSCESSMTKHGTDSAAATGEEGDDVGTVSGETGGTTLLFRTS